MKKRFVNRYGLVLALVGLLAIIHPVAAADDAPVSGVFKGNGKEAKLAYVSTFKGEPLNDKPTIVIVFSEKDHSKDKNPRTAVSFGKFGSGLIITVDEKGKIVGCLVAHSAHTKGSFNDIGTVAMSDFKLADDKIQGKISTGGVLEAFGEKWEVDLKFQAKAPKP
jgi:hypothetical protein